MKKFLLVAAAAMMVVSASAQLDRKSAGSKAMARQNALPTASFKKYMVAGQNMNPAVLREQKLMSKQFNEKLNNVTLSAATKFKAPAVKETYYAKGYDSQKTDSLLEWTMSAAVAKTDSGNVNVLVDVVPNDFGFENGVAVEYSLSGNKITIPAQLVAVNSKYGYYFFLEDGATSDGTITLNLNEDGSISGNYSIGYFAYADEERSSYLGAWTWAKNITYKFPGQAAVAPTVEYQPNNLVLFAGLGVSGYSYNNNLVMMGAYAPVNFRNSSTGEATAWDWSVEKDSDEGTEVIRSSEKNFTLNTIGGESYTNFSLVGINENAKSDSVKWGVGKSLNNSNATRYTNLYAYAGSTASSFQFSDGSYAIMTTQDPDGDLTFYTNWATPEKASTSMSKIYIYQGKPSTPIYFEGVTLPMVNFSASETTPFNLQIVIRKCTRNPQTGKITFGDIIAKSDATIANINSDYASTSGLTTIECRGFYVEDEFGMSTELDYLFVEDEFLIEIDGWDNGSFTGILGSQDITPNNALNTTWFEKSGEEGSAYAYTSWKTSLFVGLLDAAYGYLYTTDNTDLNISADGGQAAIHVNPMLYSTDQEGNPGYRLFIESINVDGEDVEELPEWLTIGLANEDYNKGIDYDLLFQAEALPAEVAGRTAAITFFQEGAQLKVTVSQGSVEGVQTVVTSKAANGKLFDLSGRQVSGKKGLVVRDGKKFIVK